MPEPEDDDVDEHGYLSEERALRVWGKLAEGLDVWNHKLLRDEARKAANFRRHAKALRAWHPWQTLYRELRDAGMSIGAARKEIGRRRMAARLPSTDTTLKHWLKG